MEPKRSFWADAAKGGTVIGFILFIFLFLSVKFAAGNTPSAAGTILWWLELITFTLAAYSFTKNRAAKYGQAGFTYGQGIGYIAAMMLFAGIIYGLGTYFVINHITPDTYMESLAATAERMSTLFGEQQTEEGMEIAERMLRSPFAMIMNGIFGLIIYGGFIGLFTAAFTKRLPVTGTNNTPQNE